MANSQVRISSWSAFRHGAAEVPFLSSFQAAERSKRLGLVPTADCTILPSVYTDFESHFKGSAPALSVVRTGTGICSSLFPRCVLGHLDYILLIP